MGAMQEKKRGRPAAVRTEADRRIGGNLRAFMAARNVGLSTVARWTNYDFSAVQRWRDGKDFPSDEALAALGRALGQTPESFRSERPPPFDPALVPAFDLLVLGVDVDPELVERAHKLVGDLNREHQRRLLRVSSPRVRKPIT